MKRWSVILLLFFAALLWGCGGGHDARVTAELDRADSLLRTSDTAAHSAALRQMLALDTARALQSDEALRARHALLLVQARYKCYVTEPADSALIDSALSYYTDHHGSSADHERYTRSLIYSGAVAEELGHPQQAMQHYLEAESTADPNDHFNLGYTNLRIAKLYHQYHLNDSNEVYRYRNALKYFKSSGFPHYQLICLTELGTIYGVENADSAMWFISQALELAESDPDQFFLATNYSNLSGTFFNLKMYAKAKDCAMRALNCGYEPAAAEIPKCLMFLSRSYASLGMIDSAQYYANHVVNISLSADSVNYYCMMADIARACGDSVKYQHFRELSLKTVVGIYAQPNERVLKSIETDFDKGKLSLELVDSNKQRTFLIILILLSALFGIIVLYYLKRMHRRNIEIRKAAKLLEQELEQARDDLTEEKHKFENTKNLDSNTTSLSVGVLSEIVESQLQVMNRLITQSYQYDKKPERFMKEFSEAVSLQSVDCSFFESLRFFVSLKYQLNLNELQEKHHFSDEEITFICLSCCNVPSTVMMVCMGYKNIYSIGNKKQKIKKKVNMKTYSDFIISLQK